MGLSLSSFFAAPLPVPPAVDEAAFRINALHAAVRRGDVRQIGQLLLSSSHLAGEVTTDGYSVFHLLSTLDSSNVGLEVAVLLSSSREALSLIDSRDARGFTAGHLLASNGRTAVLQHLLPAMTLDEQSSEGRTMLHLSVHHPRVVELLLQTGLTDSCDQLGVSALHIAAMVGAAESAKLLIGRSRDMANAVSQHNATPLMLACKAGHSAVVEVLLTGGADPAVHGGFGACALHRACEYGHLACVALLQKKDESLALRQDDDGQTALHYMCGSARLEADTLEKMASLLVQACPSLVNVRDYSLATPLIKASFYITRPTGPVLVRALLRLGADPTLEYSHGWNSAHVVHSEDPASPLLQEMLAKFNGVAFDSEKPRNVDNGAFQQQRGAWNRIPVAVREAVFERRAGLEAVAFRLRGAKHIVVLTGAGISTACGIPDFRSATGLYANEETRHMFDGAVFQSDPTVMYRGCAKLFSTVSTVAPSAAHKFLGHLEKANKLLRVYDQNVDGITRRVVSAELVRECHGTISQSHCSSCKLKTGCAFADAIARNAPYLACPRCGSIIRPDLVLFGEALPESFSSTQFSDLRACDLLVVLGTSLKVYPVAGLVNQVGELCPRVLINNEAVGGFTSFRDVQLLGNIDERIAELTAAIGWEDKK